MRLDRAHRDRQPLGDLGVGETARHQHHHIPLARRQRETDGRRPARSALEQATGRRR
ncbi:hypothetical protein [Streptomyces sp. SM12]|uniref:hypothetical protein n=1 Tax=Streptomyces sp. SM12 TaxID=1071602 RepID=UPI00215661EF|nr:hypothetical protein [Streptomyces sp. SM12]